MRAMGGIGLFWLEACTLSFLVGLGNCNNGYQTFVNNLSSRDIVGTTSYSPGISAFIKRVVLAGKLDKDATENCVKVHLELWVKGATLHNSVDLGCDTSIVAFDTSDKAGVEIWTSVYGQLSTKDQKLITIYPDASPFVLTPITQALPTNSRWATLQDTAQRGPLATTMNHGEKAYLVDGWIGGFDDGFPSGSNYRDDLTLKLGIAYVPDNADGDVDTDNVDVDIVPDGADPNKMLETFIMATDPQSTLAKRDLTEPAGTGQRKAILALIDLWKYPSLDIGLKQKTLYSLGGYRIDQQSNGAFNKEYMNPDGSRFYVPCYNVAVQAGSAVYASINVPAGEFLTAGGIRKLLIESLNEQKVLSFVKAARPRPHKWLAILSTGIMLIAGAVAL